jgi:hypothetical protein
MRTRIWDHLGITRNTSNAKVDVEQRPGDRTAWWSMDIQCGSVFKSLCCLVNAWSLCSQYNFFLAVILLCHTTTIESPLPTLPLQQTPPAQIQRRRAPQRVHRMTNRQRRPLPHQCRARGSNRPTSTNGRQIRTTQRGTVEEQPRSMASLVGYNGQCRRDLLNSTVLHDTCHMISDYIPISTDSSIIQA